MTIIMTGWSPQGFVDYARDCVSTWRPNMPAGWEILAYVEDFVTMVGVTQRLLPADAVDFIGDFKPGGAACGRVEMDGFPWKDVERAAGYSWRFDAVRFCRQMFIPSNVIEKVDDGEIVVWLDADVKAFAPVAPDLFADLLGDADLAFLGREPKHSEIGFWAIRVTNETRVFVEMLAQEYRTRDVFKHREWHSAFIFDRVRERMRERRHPLVECNLTPGGRGHVWFTTRLGESLDHLKGDRKKLGRSPERR